MIGDAWTQKTTAGLRRWYKIACSNDGAFVIAITAEYNPLIGYLGYIYTSNDSGVTWTQRTTAGYINWTGVCCNSDGTKLYACAAVDGAGVATEYIYTSTDYGVTWTALTSAGKKVWWDITCSSNGAIVYAVRYAGGVTDLCTFSTDSGANWTTPTDINANGYMECVTCSNDGTKVWVWSDQRSYYSTDTGANWTYEDKLPAAITAQIGAGAYTITYACVSSDGTKHAVAILKGTGHLLVSTDSGVTWSLEAGDGNSFTTVACSDTGATMIAGSRIGNSQISIDSGTTWSNLTALGTIKYPGVCVAGNGLKIYAACGGNGAPVTPSIFAGEYIYSTSGYQAIVYFDCIQIEEA